ncbi:hypothetical protein LPJ70_003544 [Coemansia sp. RSA 2708]|nr:hypothetical protein LPJ70_003544 [Coemansia sp. RSA 2708]
MHVRLEFQWLAGLLALSPVRAQVGDTEPFSTYINNVKGGVLVKHGKQTSCSLAVIDSSAAVVAASCLDLDSNLSADLAGTELYLDGGIDGTAAKHSVDSATVHPAYNATSLTNNLAVLAFNSGQPIAWRNSLAPPYLFGAITNGVHYALADPGKMTWDTPSYSLYSNPTTPQCNALSAVYAANPDNVMCFERLVDMPGSQLTACPVPYGIMYAKIDSNITVAALHSFSALTGGSDLCSYSQYRSFYTLLGRYRAFFEQTIGRDISVYYDPAYRDQYDLDSANDPGFHLNETTATVSLDVKRLTDDFYAGQSTESGESAQPSAAESSSETLPSDASQQPDAGNGNSGSSQRTGIIVGVCIAVLGLCAIGAILYYLRWRRKRSPNVVDPMRNNDFQDMLSTFHAGPITNHDPPPVYQEHPPDS